MDRKKKIEPKPFKKEKADAECLTELLFLGSRKKSIDSKQFTQEKASIIEDTIKWLDIYFSGRHSGFYPEV